MIKGEIALAIKISHLTHFGVSNCRLSFWGPVSLRNSCCRWQLLQQHLPASTTQDSGRGRVCGGWLPVSSIWHPCTASVQRQSGTPDRGWPVWWWFGGRWHVMIGSCGEMMDDYSGENDMWWLSMYRMDGRLWCLMTTRRKMTLDDWSMQRNVGDFLLLIFE